MSTDEGENLDALIKTGLRDPIAIGLFLTVIHLVAIPVSNASVNPARSTATAIFGGAEAWGSLWLFWAAPIVGGIIGGAISKWLQED